MAASLESLVWETKRNKLSLIGPLSEEAVIFVWEKVAWFVETLMLQKKAVSIRDLGTFTFTKRKIEVGHNRAILIQRPVFVMSEKFKQTHSLHCVKKHASGQIPLHTLNYTHLSNETGISRELVEGAVREVLQTLSRAIATGKNIEFDIKDVGRLTIHDGKAKMSFFREFIYRLDGCCEMDGLFRSESTDSSICSIMTNPRCFSSQSRPSTSLSLPKIVQPVEEDGEMNLSLECCDASSSSPNKHSSYDDSCLSRRLKMATISEEDEDGGEEDEEQRDKRNTRGRRHPCEGVYTVDENGALTTTTVVAAPTPANSPSKSHHKMLVPKPAMLIVRDSPNALPAPLTPPTHHHHHHSTTSGSSTTQKKVRVKNPEAKVAASSSCSKCSRCCTSSCTGTCSCSMGPTPHHMSRPSSAGSHKSSAGQELCYLCYQRAIRNVPVDLSREKEAMEKLYKDTMYEYHHRHDLLAMARVQAEKTKKRLHDQDIATFNQTKAKNTKKQQGAKSSKMDPSYIFRERAITPAPQASHQRYCRELDHQVETKASRRWREREEEEESGRQEQERLARELAAQEELYRVRRAQAVEGYKAALNEQVALKALKNEANADCESCSVIPLLVGGRGRGTPSDHAETLKTTELSQDMAATSDHPCHNSHTHRDHHHQHQHPVFGVQPTSPEAGERERAKAFFLDQLAMAEEKQRRAREKALLTLQEESEMLRTAKNGLKEDQRKERSRKTRARQALEKEWLVSMREKQRRLQENLHKARKQGIRLHQQCEEYQRCKQCKRKTQNFGHSNILHETRYISGARLMV